MDCEAGRVELLGVEQGELRDLIATLLYQHDRMCGGDDCEYTARRITPHIFEWFQDRQPTPDSGLREALERVVAVDERPISDGGKLIEVLRTARSALQHNTGERGDG